MAAIEGWGEQQHMSVCDVWGTFPRVLATVWMNGAEYDLGIVWEATVYFIKHVFCQFNDEFRQY